MKNQNQSNKLNFNKAAVIDLNDTQLRDINGGTSIDGGGVTCTGCCCVTVNEILF